MWLKVYYDIRFIQHRYSAWSRFCWMQHSVLCGLHFSRTYNDRNSSDVWYSFYNTIWHLSANKPKTLPNSERKQYSGVRFSVCSGHCTHKFTSIDLLPYVLYKQFLTLREVCWCTILHKAYHFNLIVSSTVTSTKIIFYMFWFYIQYFIIL